MNVCMLVYTFYKNDNRVMRYAETLVKRGDSVDVISLRREGEPSLEVINGVNVFQIQERIIDETGKLSYLKKILQFFLKSSLFLTKKHLANRYDLIHVHNVPDFLVFTAWLPKINGTKIILDIHDVVPELFASKFNIEKKSLFYKLLVFVEKMSISFSSHVIIANDLWYKTITSRSVKYEKCTAILNYPDTSVFFKRPKKRKDDKFIFIYPGSLNWHQGLDIAIKAFSIIKNKFPEAELHIYGEGPEKETLIQLVKDLKLGNQLFFKKQLPIDVIAGEMSESDIGLVPKRAVSFGNEAFSTKTLEFMSLGVPIIVSRTKIDQFYFDDSLVKFFKSEDENDMADAMGTLIENESLREQLAKNSLKYVEMNSWEFKKSLYLDLVDSLTKNCKK